MAEETKFDLVVIGGGPGGYVAAIRAAQLGMKVACVDKGSALGGTCLNVGCIPSKALLDSSELYHQARGGLAVHGVGVGEVKLNLKAMLGRKDKVVRELTQGIALLFKKNKVTRFQGAGRLVSPTEVEVTPDGAGEQKRISGKRLLIATGSRPMALPSIPTDGKRVITSTEALTLTKVPKHMIVIGGGVIGLELGSVWGRLGAKVTVIEMLPQLLGGLDGQINRLTLRAMKRQGLDIHLSTKVTAVESKGRGVRVTAKNAKDEELELKGDIVLMAVGRRPYSEGLGARELGVVHDDSGRITVDGKFRTNLETVHAVGDIIAGPMLAHKASEEGLAAVEGMAGHPCNVNYEAIPWVVYTWPEVAWVGRGEEELKAAGINYKVGTYPFQANPRAKAMGETEGMVKVIADAKNDRLLGLFVIGPRASDVIAEAVLAFEFGASAEDIARTIHAHPTLSEALKEAALGVAGEAIHI